MTCANIDGVSTAMNSSCSDAILSRPRSLDDLVFERFRGGDDPVLALAFCRVQRGIGRREQLAELVALGIGGNAEAGGHGKLLPIRHPQLAALDRRACTLGEPSAALDVSAGKHERELLAAPTAGDVALTHGPLQCGGERLEHLVACGVAVTVVHLLEVVEVGEHDTHGVAETRGTCKLGAQCVLETAAVREASQAVDKRLPLDDAM